jgi:probable rRNA maturation factor
MDIRIINQQKKVPLKPLRIKKTVKKILASKRIRQGSLSIVFVTDAKIKSLNKRYKKHDYVTDVLSFDLRTPLKSERSAILLGEIVISPATAVRQSKEYGTTLDQEMMLYVIHGILHLLGYDDHTPARIKQMRLQEKRLLKFV